MPETFDDDRPTMVPCPKCEGEGMVREETRTEVRGWTCDLCDGSCVVTVTVMREFKVAALDAVTRPTK